MSKWICVVCDYELDDIVIEVCIGGVVVEVCCDECVVKLKEVYVFV